MLTFKEYLTETNAIEYVSEAKMSKEQIDKLKTEYEKVNRIDPSSQTYKRLVATLDKMDQETLKQIADAKIKFVSRLALNRVKK